MQSQMGLLVTVLLLFIAVAAVVLTSMHRKLKKMERTAEPVIGDVDKLYTDTSVGNKKKVISAENKEEDIHFSLLDAEEADNEVIMTKSEDEEEQSCSEFNDTPMTSSVIILNVVAKESKQFIGYELLQALLSAGMRFGEMKIFHRYKETSGQGPVLFSLASITEPGTFDIHNMGAYVGRGLSFFMQLSGNPTIDSDRFDLMLDTAKQLTDDLDGRLLDDRYKSFSEKRLMTYLHCIRQNIPEEIMAEID